MKRTIDLILILIVISFFQNTLKGQDISSEIKPEKVKRKHYIGINLGIMPISFETGDWTISSRESYEHKIFRCYDVSIGLFYDINPWKGPGMQMEVGYNIINLDKSTYFVKYKNEKQSISGEPSSIYESADYEIKQNTIFVDLLLRYGFGDSNNMYFGIGGKVAIRQTPIFKDTDTMIEIKDDKYQETDIAIYLSVGSASVVQNTDTIIIPAIANIGIWLTPCFEEISKSGRFGFFLETKIGFGLGLF